MPEGLDAVASATPQAAMVPATPAAPAPAANGRGLSFHEFLSELNPLQYIPVVGTIYRAVTGDTIPESARAVGSLVVSGLTGGPIGMAMNVALLGLEKATGFDPEQVGTRLLASIGIGHSETPDPTVATAAAVPAATSDAAPATAWSPSQLSAYGITMDAGTLTRGGVTGSDVLNDLVLASIGAKPTFEVMDDLTGVAQS